VGDVGDISDALLRTLEDLLLLRSFNNDADLELPTAAAAAADGDGDVTSEVSSS